MVQELSLSRDAVIRLPLDDRGKVQEWDALPAGDFAKDFLHGGEYPQWANVLIDGLRQSSLGFLVLT